MMTTPVDTLDSVRIDSHASSPCRQPAVERDSGGGNVAVERRLDDRRSGQRRRQIDPTTCERDYTNDEIEFMQALDVYKRSNGRMFPTCSEILEVVRGLGYVRLSEDGTSRPAAISGARASSELDTNADWEE